MGKCGPRFGKCACLEARRPFCDEASGQCDAKDVHKSTQFNYRPVGAPPPPVRPPSFLASTKTLSLSPGPKSLERARPVLSTFNHRPILLPVPGDFSRCLRKGVSFSQLKLRLALVAPRPARRRRLPWQLCDNGFVTTMSRRRLL